MTILEEVANKIKIYLRRVMAISIERIMIIEEEVHQKIFFKGMLWFFCYLKKEYF